MFYLSFTMDIYCLFVIVFLLNLCFFFWPFCVSVALLSLLIVVLYLFLVVLHDFLVILSLCNSFLISLLFCLFVVDLSVFFCLWINFSTFIHHFFVLVSYVVSLCIPTASPCSHLASPWSRSVSFCSDVASLYLQCVFLDWFCLSL